MELTRGVVALETVAVSEIDWTQFSRGAPTHDNADQVKAWLLTTLKYALNDWWNTFKNFDAQSSSHYIDFLHSTVMNGGSDTERRYRESTSMALALAVALSTGIYDASVVGVSESVARDRALQLIRSLAYRHDINAPGSQSNGRWGYEWQTDLFAAHTAFAAWLLWDHLPAADQLLVKRIVVAEADTYRSPLYFKDRDGNVLWPGNSKGEDQGWNAQMRSLAAVMMPDHPHADMWKSESILLMLSTYSRPEDVSSDEAFHGHALSDWLNGSNMHSNATVPNHGIIHPDYMAAGLVEFNTAHIYFMANLATPVSGFFNTDRVMEAFVELEFTPGGGIRQPGGTIFRSETDCGTANSLTALGAVAGCVDTAVTAGQSFEAGHQRGCLAGPPGTDTNVYYPNGSSWSKKRRPNLAMFVAQVDAFDLDHLVDDPTLHADYWLGCFARDVRAMQARYSNGRTWRDNAELSYFGREGQSTVFAAKAWMAYWIEHQAGAEGVTTQDDYYDLEFNRILSIEAEANTNTRNGNLITKQCNNCSGRTYVRFRATGDTNSLVIPNIDVGVTETAGKRHRLYLVHESKADSTFKVTVTGQQPGETGQYLIRIRGFHRFPIAHTEAEILLYPGTNTLTIVNVARGGFQPNIDRVILSPLPITATPQAQLSNLELSDVALTPEFDPEVLNYDAQVAHEVSTTTVTATTAHTEAQTTITPADDDTTTDGDQVDLDVGDNTVTVTVTAQDTTIAQTYTVKITRLADEPQLASATVDGTELTLTYSETLDDGSEPPTSAFSATVTDAATTTATTPTVSTVDVSGTDVTLTLATAVRHNDTVTITYTVPPSNPIQDTGTTDAAALAAQTVTNNTTAAATATLSTLGLEDPDNTTVALDPQFGSADDTDGTYSADVANEVASVTVTGATTDTRAQLTATPTDDDTTTNGYQINLDVGDNTITVTVTAENGTTTNTYTITVTRPPPLALIDGAELTLTYGDALDETSEPAAGDFSVSVVDSVTSATSTPAVTDVDVTGAVVTLTLAAAVRHGDTVTVDYTAGANPIRDLATNNADDLDDKAVTNVTVAASDATLSVLSLADAGGAAVALTPVFDAVTVSYSASVAYEVVWVTLAASAADSRASVVVEPADGDSVLAHFQLWPVVGANTVTVTVTAEDSSTSETYTLELTRGAVALETVAVTEIDWTQFTRGEPTHLKAVQTKSWLLTALKYALNDWWNTFKNFDAQSGTYLDFVNANLEDNNPGSVIEEQHRDSAAMALAIAVVLGTGIYDASVVGVSESVARDRALKLIRSLAYRHDINAPVSQTQGRWGFSWQSAMWAAHAGYAAWLLWGHLPAADQLRVKRMITAEADTYRSPLYYRDRTGTVKSSGNSKTEEQAWDSYVLSLAAVMMPDHPNADYWETQGVHLMLSSYSHPDDVSSGEVFHGHALSDWLNGSNIHNNATVTNHGIIHPDYMASGVVEFNAGHIYFLANLDTPVSGFFNADRVIEAFVELEFTPEGYTQQPGGTIFRPGTDCGTANSFVALTAVTSCMDTAVAAGQSFEAGHQRGCLAGPPGTDTNVYYPNGSSWSKKRRPNLAMFVAQADAFDLDHLVDDPTLHADYWLGCFVRDVRAMQARYSNGRTWRDNSELTYFGREGQSAHYGAKAWMANWIEHQIGGGVPPTHNDFHNLEFNRILSIEAEANTNTRNGDLQARGCGDCSDIGYVRFRATGDTNSLVIPNVDAGITETAGKRHRLYLVHESKADSTFKVTVTGQQPGETGQYLIRIPGFQRRPVDYTEAEILLYPGANTLTIVNVARGSFQPNIDRVILSPLPITATPQAQLSNLALSDVALTPEFDPEVLNYQAQVAHGVSTTTVTATTAHTEAQTTITPADDDTTTDGDQVGLDVGDNTVTVTVTAQDTTIAQTYTVNVTRLADEPQLASATVDGTELTLTYSETLNDGSEPPTSAFSVTVTDAATATATTPTVSTVDIDGADVTLTLATAVRHNDTVTITYTVPPTNPIQDTGTTDAAALTAQTVTNNTTAASTATLESLGLEDPDNTTVTLDPQFGSADDTDGTYSADVANEVASVTVSGATTDTRAQLTATPTDADTTTNGYQIDLPTALTEATTTTITVTVTAEDTTTTSTYTITVTRAPDTTAPSLTSATADGTALVLAYDEALDETSQPAASDFAVSVTDSVTTTTTTPAVTDVDITGTDVTLTLAAAVRHNDTVTLDYTPGTNPTQDLAANDAAALASQAVTNNTATATDTTLAALALADPGGTAVALSPVFGSPEDTTNTYTAQVANEVAYVTVTVATTTDSRAQRVISPTDTTPPPMATRWR